MKIAIRGHEARGEEVIQILESLGGVNRHQLDGDSLLYYYIDHDDDKTIHCHDDVYVNKYCKKYTLEEFEKEFPFKPGDTVIDKDGDEGCIAHLCNINGCVYYSVKYNYNQFTVQLPKSLKLKFT
jgi:hypothetical protein